MQLRPGGTAEDNLFSRCINSLIVGPATVPVAGGVFGVIRRNVFLEGTGFSPLSNTPGMRAQGINIANLHPGNGLRIEGNIFAADMSEGHYGHAISASGQNCGSGNAYPCPIDNLRLVGNIIYNWRGGFRFSGTLGSEFTGVTVQDNVMQNPGDDRAMLLNLSSGFDATHFSFSGNRYDRGGDTNWMRVSGTDYDFAGWVGMSGETDGQAAVVTLPDPTRSLGSYDATQGGAGTHDSFMQRARAQSKNNWDPAYEAITVNAYLRAGFTP